MKKVSLGILVMTSIVLVVLMALAGCASTSSTTTPAVTSPATGPPSPTSSVSRAPSVTSPTGQPLGSVEVIGQWGGEELASFQAMVAPWEQQTGGKMNFTGTRDTIAILTTRIAAGNPPDVAILPNPGQMRQLAAAGNLVPLNNLLDMTTINAQYPPAWTSLATVNNKLYGIFMKATNKGMIWYDPKTFTSNNWSIPTTWTDLINLSNRIVSDAKTPKYPWSVGVESAQSSGWPGTDWIAEIFLSKYGGDAYDQWVNHQIPWTDPRIKDAWQMFGSIVTTAGYVPGGTTAVLATNFQNASYLPFETPSEAAMYYEGDFVQGFISTQFPNLVAGQDYSFFNFPTINDQYKGAIIGGADVVVAFKDNPTVKSFVSYLATPQAQDIWVKRGGFTSVNNQISISDYPVALAGKSAQQLLNAGLFRYGAGDIMPSAMQTAWWTGMLNYLQNPNQLDSILANLEKEAVSAYASPTPTASP